MNPTDFMVALNKRIEDRRRQAQPRLTEEFYMRCPAGWTGEAHRGWDNAKVKEHEEAMAQKYRTPLVHVTYEVGRFAPENSVIFKSTGAVKQHNRVSAHPPRNDRPGQYLC